MWLLALAALSVLAVFGVPFARRRLKSRRWKGLPQPPAETVKRRFRHAEA